MSCAQVHQRGNIKSCDEVLWAPFKHLYTQQILSCAQSHTMDQAISKGQRASEKQSLASLWLCDKLFFRESPCQISFQDFCFRAISERLSDWSLNVLNRILYNGPLQQEKRVGGKTAVPLPTSWIGEIRWLLCMAKLVFISHEHNEKSIN